MYKIIVKFKDGKEEIFQEYEYDKACALANDKWSIDVRSIHLREEKSQ